MRYAYFRGAGYDAPSAQTGALGSFIFPTAGRLVLPLPAVVLLLATGQIDRETLIIGGIVLVVLAALACLAVLLLRSDRSARWAGDKLARPGSWVLVWLKRPRSMTSASVPWSYGPASSPPCAGAGSGARWRWR